jgi:hypothetical protein
MSAENWRYEYLSTELVEHRKRLEEAQKLVKEMEQELIAAEWQRNKYKAIVEMLEVAYNNNVKSQSDHSKPTEHVSPI